MEEIDDYIHDSCIDMALVLLIFLIDMGIDCIYLSYEDVYHNGTFLLSFFNFKFFGLKNFFWVLYKVLGIVSRCYEDDEEGEKEVGGRR
jgi:hypothetical protein